MTTPHKALLIQARDALAYTTDPDSPHYEDQLAAIAALTAAIDAPEPKGLFIDMIARHEGLAEELRDLPEPYDQQALEPCPVCGWKAIVPGEPCLMCERNAKMLVPEPEPTAFDITLDDDDALSYLQAMVAQDDGELTPVRLLVGGGHSGYGLYVASADYPEEGAVLLHQMDVPNPPAVREPLSDKQISRLWSEAHNDTSDRMAFQVLARAIEAAHGIKS